MIRQRQRVATYVALAALVSVLLLPSCSTAQQSVPPATDPFPQELRAERIGVDQLAGGGPLQVGAKRTGPYVDRVFRDSLGREVLLRGYNVTSRTLVTRGGLTPFTDLEQARTLTDRLRRRTGANVARFLISWEGTHPEVDRIDTDYLRTIAEQIQVLTDRGIYVVLDYHQDNFSRHLVPHGHGDGAPAWVTPGLPRRPCGPPCVDSVQHYLVNRSVRMAFRNFWDNAEFPTPAGPRRLQDEFLWQLARVLAYLRDALPAPAFERVLGVEPMNEPVDGGRRGMSAAAWDNQKLWPFYRRVRGVLDDAGWGAKLVFAGPSAFWNTNLGLPGGNQGLLRTGGGHLSAPPGARLRVRPALLRHRPARRTGTRPAGARCVLPGVRSHPHGGAFPGSAGVRGRVRLARDRRHGAGSRTHDRRCLCRAGRDRRPPRRPAPPGGAAAVGRAVGVGYPLVLGGRRRRCRVPGGPRTWWSAPIRAGSRATC